MLLNALMVLIIIFVFLMFGVLVFAIAFYIYECIRNILRGYNSKVDAQQSWSESFTGSQGEYLAKKFNCNIPKALIDLFESDLSKQNNITLAPSLDAPQENHHYIAFFEPVEQEHTDEGWEDCEKFFTIANDGGGNLFIIDPRMDDPPVLFYDHEGGVFTYVCDSITEFLQWEILPEDSI